MNRIPTKKVPNARVLRQRYEKLKTIAKEYSKDMARGEAYELVSEYKFGLRDGSLRLRRLAARTIMAKRRMGFTQPDSPLYGKGLEGNRTLAKAFKVYKTGNSFTVKPSKQKHHSADLTLEQLHEIHENGCTIKNGFGRGIMIRIPARPAFKNARMNVTRRKTSERRQEGFEKAFLEYLEGARVVMFRKIKVWADKHQERAKGNE